MHWKSLELREVPSWNKTATESLGVNEKRIQEWQSAEGKVRKHAVDWEPK